jgi:hypothetical protein
MIVIRPYHPRDIPCELPITWYSNSISDHTPNESVPSLLPLSWCCSAAAVALSPSPLSLCLMHIHFLTRAAHRLHSKRIIFSRFLPRYHFTITYCCCVAFVIRFDFTVFLRDYSGQTVRLNTFRRLRHTLRYYIYIRFCCQTRPCDLYDRVCTYGTNRSVVAHNLPQSAGGSSVDAYRVRRLIDRRAIPFPRTAGEIGSRKQYVLCTCTIIRACSAWVFGETIKGSTPIRRPPILVPSARGS